MSPRIARSTSKRGDRGQTLAEFALVIPLFLLVVVGIAEGGYYVAATTIVSHATHEGARQGILESTSSLSAITSRVQDAAGPLVSVAGSDVSYELNDIACDDTCYGGRESGDRLQVITRYTHRPLASYVFDGLTFPANAEAELWVE
jgi:hypothetical protein